MKLREKKTMKLIKTNSWPNFLSSLSLKLNWELSQHDPFNLVCPKINWMIVKKKSEDEIKKKIDEIDKEKRTF